MFVARVSSESLAAVTLAYPVTMLIGAMSTGIGVGINSAMSGSRSSYGSRGPDRIS